MYTYYHTLSHPLHRDSTVSSSAYLHTHCFARAVCVRPRGWCSLLSLCIVMILLVPVSTLIAQDNNAVVVKELADKPKTKADEKLWKLSANPSFVFTQIGLSNWAGGGQNTIALQSLFAGTANYAHNGITWDNSIELGYGVTRLGGEPWRKGDDRIILLSKFSIEAATELRYSGFLDFRTQFAPGRDQNRPELPFISQFMAPGFLTLGAGLEWKPAPYFTALVSPIGGRAVFVYEDSLSRVGAFGVQPGSNVQFNLGAVANLQYKSDIAENVTLQTRLNLFSRYDAPTLIVVNWENLILMKVNSWLTITLATDVLYDHRVAIRRDDGSVGPATQMRNVLGIAIGYKFAN
jgi:hypothetical protein